MSFFGLFKEKESSCNVPASLLEFLGNADTEYMRAFVTRSTKVLSKFLTRECQVKIGQRIQLDYGRYFGSDKFRTTEWEIVDKSEGSIFVEKRVIFDKIRVGGKTRISVADNYSEIWEIIVSNKTFVVSDIEAV